MNEPQEVRSSGRYHADPEGARAFVRAPHSSCPADAEFTLIALFPNVSLFRLRSLDILSAVSAVYSAT